MGLSGGMDSTVLLYKARNEFDEIHCLSFDYGQRHKKELQFAEKQFRLCKGGLRPHQLMTHKTIDVSFIRDISPTSSLTNDDIATPDVRTIKGEAQPKSYVPNRNMIFLSICAGYAESMHSSTIWHGAAQIDSLAGYYDGSSEWLEKINEVLAFNRENTITVEAPLITLSKKEIIKLGLDLGVDFSQTWTCYDGKEKPSIYSASSSLRLRGFIDNGIRDPLEYKEVEELEALYKKYGV